jgi:hypothetical protein
MPVMDAKHLVTFDVADIVGGINIIAMISSVFYFLLRFLSGPVALCVQARRSKSVGFLANAGLYRMYCHREPCNSSCVSCSMLCSIV